ncbi:hypothetical protein WG66_004380 [Moniliophthora roreri]|nr:hypothetical protein WG66_004380 [Moniliophthora roreri]
MGVPICLEANHAKRSKRSKHSKRSRRPMLVPTSVKAIAQRAFDWLFTTFAVATVPLVLFTGLHHGRLSALPAAPTVLYGHFLLLALVFAQAVPIPTRACFTHATRSPPPINQ